MATRTTNNLSDLTSFFDGFNKIGDFNKKERDEKEEKTRALLANKSLSNISDSFRADNRLQKKLVKWSKIDMGMDVAAFIQDKESKGFLAEKQTRDTKAGIEEAKGREMEGKIEEHGSINNDLLARIEIVLVTRLDRILDGIKLMLPTLDKDRFKGSEFNPKDFSKAVKKSQDITNNFLKTSIDDLRHERYNRKNKREIEEIAALRSRGKKEDADKKEKTRKAKELRLEGFNEDGTLLRNKPRGYFRWKHENRDREGISKQEGGGGVTWNKFYSNKGKKQTSDTMLSGGMSNDKAAKLFNKSTWETKLKNIGPKLKNIAFGLRNFVKVTGLIGILVYSIAPLIDSLKSEEMSVKWNEVKEGFLRNWEKLKTLGTTISDTGKDLWIKLEPIVAALDNMFTEIGKTVAGWLGRSIMTIADTFIDIFDGMGMLFGGDLSGIATILFGAKDNAKGGGIIGMVVNIIEDAFQSVGKLIWKFIKELDVGSMISKMLISLSPDNIWTWGEDEKEIPKKRPEKVPPAETNPAVLERRRQLDAVIEEKNAQRDRDNAAGGYTEANYNKSDVHNITNIATVPPRTQANQDVQVTRNN